MTPLFLNSKDAAHTGDDIAERGLLRAQPPHHFDLDTGKHGYALTNHIRRDLNLGPTAKIGPSLGGGPQRARFLQDKYIRFTAHDLASPTHSRVDAEKALLGRQRGQDFSYTFRFFHADIIT